MKIDKIENEKQAYVKEVSIEYIEIEVDQKYLFFVNSDELGNHIVCNGYGSFKKMYDKYVNEFMKEKH